MWKRYLHPDSVVVGLDIYSACKNYEEDGIQIAIGDQSDAAFLAEVVAEAGPFDFILDDGSHIPRHQIASFEYLFRNGLNNGGCYLVEDCQTSYWRRYGGGLRRRGTFIEYAKNVADDLSYWLMDPRDQVAHWQTDVVESVEFYASLVAFRKRAMAMPVQLEIGEVKALQLGAPFSSGRLGKLVVKAKRIPLLQEAVRRNPVLWDLMKRVMK